MDLRCWASPEAAVSTTSSPAGPHTGSVPTQALSPSWGWCLRQEPSPFSPPPQILKWPQPGAGGQPVIRTMVNMVVANAAFTYLTALTDSNIVAIWRRC